MSYIDCAGPAGPDVRVITVKPFLQAWAVDCPGVENPMIYATGGGAELAARRLGERLAAVGEWAEIRVVLRDGTTGGRFVCPPFSPAALRPAPSPLGVVVSDRS